MGNNMDKYEELYKHSKYVFDEEVIRFGRIEDKAAKFITVVTSLLAVYALTGRQLFGGLLPAKNGMDLFLITLAALVLVGLLTSWGFAFRALQVQGIKKAPLNNEILSFFHTNELINIFYGMSKQYSASLVHNRKITDLKARHIRRSFRCIVATVIFFTLFIVSSGINAATKNMPVGVITVNIKQPCKESSKSKTSAITTETSKEETNMSEKDDEIQPAPKPASPSAPATQAPERPDLDIVAPDFDVLTESFDPSKLPSNEKLGR